MLPPRRGAVAALLAALHLAALAHAGPLGPLPNVTSTEIAQKEDSCVVGDVVYGGGEEVPGSAPCERCRCRAGAVACEAVACQPRAGCKALHRPDHCCPIYQCECEQEGRVYGNGEKLVDPRDPCRVCYCQGGEVVCRRIACFVRDDCRPRRVPGRCCPEYDNCPLTGVTSIPSTSGNLSLPDVAAPDASLENIKQEITIKEITPVSEIPVVTEVKIKEILPSPSIVVPEYTSSKSPLFVREATTDKIVSSETIIKTDHPGIIEISPSATTVTILNTKKQNIELGTVKVTEDSPPSKVSLSTQDSINSEIYLSKTPEVTEMTSSVAPLLTTAATTRTATMDEEDPSLLDHNPAFPPIPDDLSVIGNNHDDETMPGQILDGEHSSDGQFDTHSSHATPSTTEVITKESPTTSKTEIIVTENIQQQPATALRHANTETIKIKESPMLNLRSAIPTEILNAPSSLPEDINGELDEPIDHTDITSSMDVVTSESSKFDEKNTDNLSTERYTKISNYATTYIDLNIDAQNFSETTLSSLGKTDIESSDLTTPLNFLTTIPIDNIKEESKNFKQGATGTDFKDLKTPTQNIQDANASSFGKTNIVTITNTQDVTSYVQKSDSEITSQTELSSLPVETSDQNPQESIREKISVSTSKSFVTEFPKIMSSSPATVTISSEPPVGDNKKYDNFETTEFVLTSFGSSEAVTNAVELIKISATAEKNAAIIAEPTKKTNFFSDLNSLVGDFAEIGDHSDTGKHTAAPLQLGSEELIPVNAGYKSKNSNYNMNSITEVPTKDKKQRIEIDDDGASITDSLPPHDKVEPTTRLPIIDNVADDGTGKKSAGKDIEILTQSYVPTINRKPTKVVMKKNNENPSAETSTSENYTSYKTTRLSEEITDKSDLFKETVSNPDVSSTTTERIFSSDLPSTTRESSSREAGSSSPRLTSRSHV